MILILIVTGLIETFLSATWNRFYFNSGILAFVRNTQVNIHHSNIPSCTLVNNKFGSGCLNLAGSLRFKELSSNVYGFRESLFPFGRMSILHGLLIFDDENNQVIVKGFLDWTVFCFVLIWLIVPPLAWLLGYISTHEPIGLVALIYFGVVLFNLVIFYLSNFFRYSAVATFATESWSRKYTNIVTG